MVVGWQGVVTLLIIVAAAVYVLRHLLRSVSDEPGSGCGVSSGCGGCAVKKRAACGQPRVELPTRPRDEH